MEIDGVSAATMAYILAEARAAAGTVAETRLYKRTRADLPSIFVCLEADG